MSRVIAIRMLNPAWALALACLVLACGRGRDKSEVREAEEPSRVRELMDQVRRETDFDSRARAAAELTELGSDAVPALVRALADSDKEVREVSVSVLIAIGEPAVPELIRGLYSPDYGLRTRAAMTLGNMGEPALEPLLRALESDDKGAVRQAAWALGLIGDPAALGGLEKLLDHPDKNLRRAAADAVSAIQGRN